MDLNHQFRFSEMANEADKECRDTMNRIRGVENGYVNKMNGRSMVLLVLSLIGNVCWIVGVIFAYFYVTSYNVNQLHMTIALFVVLFTLGVMFVDSIINYNYYGKVSIRARRLRDLNSHLESRRGSISGMTAQFMQTRDNNWNYRINAAPSVPDQLTEIERELGKMKSLSNGFLGTLKRIMYYASALAIAFAGGRALFGVAANIVDGFFDSSVEDSVMTGLFWTALVVVCIAEYFVAEWIYSLVNCEVNNLSLLASLIGPVMFMLLVLIGCLVVWGVIIAVALAIGAAVTAGVCACISMWGG